MKGSRALQAGLALSLGLALSGCARDRQSATAESPAVASVTAKQGGTLPSSETPTAAPMVSSRGQAAPAPELPQSLHVEVDAMDAETAYVALSSTSHSFDEAFAATAPDCVTGRTLQERICALAARLCRLSDRNPSEPEVRAHCVDGKGRCEAAKGRITTTCG